MDAFLARLSYHATSYAIRSCLALTSSYAIRQSSRLLKTVDDGPLRSELDQLQRRLSRKIELISPILEAIELRYTRGDSALETVVRTARGLREDIDLLAARLRAAAQDHELARDGVKDAEMAAAIRRAELQDIIRSTKELITSIDDSIPLINLWVSAIGGIQAPPSSFSPSRLLQASMLINVGDSQFILDPSQPMQIGPDFTLSLYMLFRAHSSSQESHEPYGMEEGQRRPMWQEVIHKARVRLCRVPAADGLAFTNGARAKYLSSRYSYQLQIVEDLDDGRMHTSEEGEAQPAPYDGISLAGVREHIPIFQIAKMFYADVGRILNINNEDGSSSNPVLLLKRDVEAIPVNRTQAAYDLQESSLLVDDTDGVSILSATTLSEGDTQADLDRQLNGDSAENGASATRALVPPMSSQSTTTERQWRLPRDLDPEWIALEVFEVDTDDASSSTDDASSSTDAGEPVHDDASDGHMGGHADRHHHHHHLPRPSAVDSNLINQLNRMSMASAPSVSSSRPSSSRDDDGDDDPSSVVPPLHLHVANPNPNPAAAAAAAALVERSPFGAIRTSLSLLEMLLRLASLQEFEQTTHLAIPDHVLRFYLDEGAAATASTGRAAAAAGVGFGARVGDPEAARKVGFDPCAGPGL
ncbi:Ran-binding-domain-containing protein [Xylariaceae sp. FL0804]|nr:Ran-binding-domain-containing protein [Xylariaceae sp. FL0804]